MKTKIGCAAMLLGAMGVVTGATASADNGSLAGKRGLSPIIPVMIAQANQAQASNTTTIRTIGVCRPSPNNNYSLENVSDPLLEASYYLQQFEHRTPTGPATTTILQQPKHGILRLVTEADRGTLFNSDAGPLKPDAQLYVYLPDSNYVGKDTATIQVDFGGVKVNVKYFFQAISEGLGDDWVGDYCSKTGPFWKISSTLDANGIRTNRGQTTFSALDNRGQTTFSAFDVMERVE